MITHFIRIYQLYTEGSFTLFWAIVFGILAYVLGLSSATAYYNFPGSNSLQFFYLYFLTKYIAAIIRCSWVVKENIPQLSIFVVVSGLLAMLFIFLAYALLDSKERHDEVSTSKKES